MAVNIGGDTLSLKVSKTELQIAVMLMPFFSFAVGYKWPLLGACVNVGRVCVLGYVSFMFFFRNKKTIKLIKEPVFSFLLLYYVVLGISTVFNSLTIGNAIQLAIYGVTPFLIMTLYLGKKDVKTILGGINLAFLILIVINLFIMICYPEGIYTTYSSATLTKYYLFGAKNQMVAPILIGMCFFVEHAYSKQGRLSLISLIKIGICLIELIIGGSGTGLTMAAIFLGIIILNKRGVRIFQANTSLIIIVLLFFGVIVFEQQKMFAFIIEDVLHKDLTISNRTYIWRAAIASILAHPWLGSGVSDLLSGNVLVVLSYIEKETFAHNMYLDVMVTGGIIAIAPFLLIILFTKKNYMYVHSENSFLWWALWLYLIASLFDIYTGNYCMFIIIAYILTKKMHLII